MELNNRAKRTILLGIPVGGLLVLTTLVVLGVLPPLRPYHRIIRSASHPTTRSTVLGEDEHVALYRWESPGLSGPQWMLYCQGRILVRVATPVDKSGTHQVSVYEGTKQRVVTTLDLTKGTLLKVAYWSHGEGGAIETRTDLNLDGTVDLIVSSRLKGAKILLDGRWVRAKRTRDSMELIGGEGEAKFVNERWVLSDK